MPEGSKPRVMLVNHVGAISGAESSMLTLVRHLDRRRFEPVAAVPAGRLAEELAKLEVPTSIIPELRLSHSGPISIMLGGLKLRGWSERLTAAADELKADLLVANSVTAALGCAMRAARSRPMIWHARDLRVPERALQFVIPRATRIAAISACVADTLIDGHPAAAGRTVMIHNGLDTLVFQPERSVLELRRELGVPDSSPVIATIGQLVPWKRQEVFIEAAAHIVAKQSHTHFLVVGADLFGEHPQYVTELRRMVRSLGLSERITFTGFREDIASVMSAVDVLVHPAEDEPLGRVVLEAMSLAVPCVAVNPCGPAEIIEDGETGILVARPEPREIAARVIELLSRPGAIERMGQAARRSINMRFTAERMARLTEDLYEAALAERRR